MADLLARLRARINPDFAWRLVQVYLKEGAVFLLFLLAVRLLLPADFGLYSYISAFAYFFVLIGDFGISATTTKLVAEKSVEDPASLGKVFGSALLATMITSFLSLAVVAVLALFFLQENAHLVWYVLPLVFLAPLASFHDGYYRGLRSFRLLSTIAIGAFAVTVPASVFLIARYGLVGALLAQNVFHAAFLLGSLLAPKPASLRPDRATTRELLAYSLVVGLGGIGYFLFSKIDVVILGRLGFLTEAAYYEVITKIFSLFIISFSIIGQVIAPYLIAARKDGAALAAEIRRYRRLVVRAALGAAVLALIAVPLAVRLFLPAYFNVPFLTGFAILAVLLPVDLWAVVQRQGILVPLGLARVVTASIVVGGIANVVLDLVLIHLLGFVGVFVGTVVVHCGVLAYQEYFVRKTLLAAR